MTKFVLIFSPEYGIIFQTGISCELSSRAVLHHGERAMKFDVIDNDTISFMTEKGGEYTLDGIPKTPVTPEVSGLRFEDGTLCWDGAEGCVHGHESRGRRQRLHRFGVRTSGGAFHR